MQLYKQSGAIHDVYAIYEDDGEVVDKLPGGVYEIEDVDGGGILRRTMDKFILPEVIFGNRIKRTADISIRELDLTAGNTSVTYNNCGGGGKTLSAMYTANLLIETRDMPVFYFSTSTDISSLEALREITDSAVFILDIMPDQDNPEWEVTLLQHLSYRGDKRFLTIISSYPPLGLMSKLIHCPSKVALCIPLYPLSEPDMREVATAHGLLDNECELVIRELSRCSRSWSEAIFVCKQALKERAEADNIAVFDKGMELLMPDLNAGVGRVTMSIVTVESELPVDIKVVLVGQGSRLVTDYNGVITTLSYGDNVVVLPDGRKTNVEIKNRRVTATGLVEGHIMAINNNGDLVIHHKGEPILDRGHPYYEMLLSAMKTPYDKDWSENKKKFYFSSVFTARAYQVGDASLSESALIGLRTALTDILKCV